jgi:hypothetical protein
VRRPKSLCRNIGEASRRYRHQVSRPGYDHAIL